LLPASRCARHTWRRTHIVAGLTTPDQALSAGAQPTAAAILCTKIADFSFDKVWKKAPDK
jgi:hypothetical protein